MSEKKYELEIVDLRMLRQRLIRHENWVKDPRSGEPLNLQHTDIRLALREAECAREAGAHQETDPLQNRCLNDANLSDCLGLLPEHLSGSSLVRAVLPSSITYQEMQGERQRVLHSHQRFVLALLLWGIYISLTYFSVPEIRWAMPSARVMLPLCAVSVPSVLFLQMALVPYVFLGLGERRTRLRGNFLLRQMPARFPDGQPPTPEPLPKKLYAMLIASSLSLALLFVVRCFALHQPMLSLWHAVLLAGILGILGIAGTGAQVPLKRLFCLVFALMGVAWCVVQAPSSSYAAQITARLQALQQSSLVHNANLGYRTDQREEKRGLHERLAPPLFPLGDWTPRLVLVAAEDKKLMGADMTGASLRFLEAPYSHWDASCFVGVDATGASFSHSHLPSVTFTRRTPHAPTHLNFADFTAANVSGIEAEGVEATHTNFTHATLTQANLRLANLTAANLYQAVLDHANFSGAYLRDADLSETSASNCQFIGAYASHARFDGANLASANLHECNLQAAVLVRTNLHATDFTRANLQEADCTGADFTDAKLEDSVFSSQTLWSSGKPWPDKTLEKQYRAVSLTDQDGNPLPNIFRLEKIPQKHDTSDKK
jgi:uncharacterized protein YjbI with pentapeptide repeats